MKSAEPTETGDPWALATSFYSIIVKREAVLRSFPGGVEEFERALEPPSKNGALYLMPRLSLDDVEHALRYLNGAGLIPGQDVAVAEMGSGPLLKCPGLIFRREGELLDVHWTVNVAPVAPMVAAQPQSVAEPSANPAEPSATPGEPGNAAPAGGGDWAMLATRGAVGAIDSWDEYLCACRTEKGFLLNVQAHEWLGEVPTEWYDEDGQLRPEHQHGDGEMKLPSECLGRPVTGHRDGGFIGELVSTSDDGLEIADVSERTVFAALVQLGWHTSDTAQVHAGLLQLCEEGRTGDQQPQTRELSLSSAPTLQGDGSEWTRRVSGRFMSWEYNGGDDEDG